MEPYKREDERYSLITENRIGVEERFMFSILPEGKGRTLLDVGCGVGNITLELRNRGYAVTGVDFSSVGVQRALERGVSAIVSDVDRDGLKFPDKSVHVVWAGDVIEHVFDPILLLKEVHRVLKDDGFLLFTVPNDFNLSRRICIFLTGNPTQFDIYRRFNQCKHHTFFSWSLLRLLLNRSSLHVRSFHAVLRIPWSGREFITHNVMLGRYFGRVFIVMACKGPG